MLQNSASPAARSRFHRPAAEALDSALTAGLAGYDRSRALARFHRLAPEIIAAATPAAARQVLAEIESAMRRERARAGRRSYDLNRHIALLVAHRAESARLREILGASQVVIKAGALR